MTTHQIVGSLSSLSTFIAESIGILRRCQTSSPPAYFSSNFFDDNPCRRDITTIRLVESRSSHRRQECQQPSSSHSSSHVCLPPKTIPHTPARGWRYMADPLATKLHHLTRLPSKKLRSSLDLLSKASNFVFYPVLSLMIPLSGLFLFVSAHSNSPTSSIGFSHFQ